MEQRKKTVTFDELRGTIRRLRSPGGCPWDREQTLESLRPCLINETTEVLAGIDLCRESKNGDNLCEELGDVLLQVMMMSDIAADEGLFTLDDVIAGLNEKMIRRHPHVFGTDEVKDAEGVLVKWEEIKQKERRDEDPAEKEREKAAFRAAAGEVIRHLTEKIGK